MVIAGSHGLGERYQEDVNATMPIEIGKGPSGVAAASAKPVVVEDVLIDDLFAPWRGFAKRGRYRATLSVPLRLDRRVIGVLNVYRAKPGPWSQHDVDLASLLADHAAIAVRTADLLDKTRRQVDGLSLMVRSLRAQAHEHANRLHAIYGLLVLGEVREAQRMIATVEDGYHSTYATVIGRIENPAIAGLLVAEAAVARESGIDLAIDRRSRLRELPEGLSDLDAVTILGNLMHNAIDAVAGCPRSRRRVRVKLTQRHGETNIAVRDWGRGIAPEHLEHLFDRDFTTKPGHDGLGLHLVAALVTRTGGTLNLERLQQGVEIVVTYKS
jgi:signal transduction histidine kinase